MNDFIVKCPSCETPLTERHLLFLHQGKTAFRVTKGNVRPLSIDDFKCVDCANSDAPLSNKVIDPRFTLANKEIAEILAAYDLGSTFILASPRGLHIAHRWEEPTWSLLAVEALADGTFGVKLKAHKENEDIVEDLESTLGMLGGMANLMQTSAGVLFGIEEGLKQQYPLPDRANEPEEII